MDLLKEIRAEANNEYGRGELNGVHKALMLVAASELERLSELVWDLKTEILQWCSDVPDILENIGHDKECAYIPNEDKCDCGFAEAVTEFETLSSGIDEILNRCKNYDIAIGTNKGK